MLLVLTDDLRLAQPGLLRHLSEIGKGLREVIGGDVGTGFVEML